MKKLMVTVCMFVIWLFISSPVFADVVGSSRLSLIQGDVLVQTNDTGNEWVAASINLPLMPGDKVWVPDDGRAEIQFLGRSYIRADRNTSIDITSLRRDSEGNITQVSVPEGRVYINYKGSAVRNSVFQVDTPFISAMSYGSAKFDIQVYDNGYTEISVIDGAVYVEGQYGNTKVERGDMLSISSDNYAEVSQRRPRDEWLKWNQSRDSDFVRLRTSIRYLPPSLDGYSSDFDEYGRWVHTPDYGYVWRPVIMVSNWAPYRHGRWIWRNGDYVWISYEPWGWVPYHYGRWAFRVGIGWFWVPPAKNAVFWSPGFVAWIHTPTYISWVPLAPEEIYYGYGYYGPHSVNLTKVNIKNIHVTNIYKNTHVAHAVSIVSHDTFITGRHAKVIGAPANPFTGGVKVSVGRPDIKPVKSISAPLPMKVVPYKSLPPQKIGEIIKTKGLHDRHIAAKENMSVFKEGKPALSMHVNKVRHLKPVPSIQKSERMRPPEQKEIREKPAVMPRESIGKPPIQKKEKDKRHMPQGTTEKPKTMPKERENIPTRQQKESNPAFQKGIKERSTIMHKEGADKRHVEGKMNKQEKKINQSKHQGKEGERE